MVCFFRRAKIGQLNKPVIENTFVYAYLLVNFFVVRKNGTGTGGRSFCTGKENQYSDGVFYQIKIRDYSEFGRSKSVLNNSFRYTNNFLTGLFCFFSVEYHVKTYSNNN